jgi:hypothetical protein
MPFFTPSADPAGSRTSQNTIWTLVVTVLLLAAGVAASVTATARADPPVAAPSQHEKPPPTPWGACPINGRDEAEHKFVRSFPRGPGVSTIGEVMPGGESLLVCGHDGYGYYHVANNHGAQWTQKGVKTSENWRAVADYAIADPEESAASELS